MFIDVDHLFDYYLNKGFSFKLNLMDFYKTCMDCKLSKFYFLLHSFELLIISWLITIAYPTNLILLGIAIGMSQHLIFDVIFNKISLKGYFLSYRLIKSFKASSLLREYELY
ncbi:MAG: hypothetical protein AMJ78_02320 [Omnitrophica WOR_2 bacterium SM23_29]|nr:MAG: hypothetical protein AMJ78_02320 [Omnitrophica WOR_2 bacterium SM23_29]